MEGSVAAAQYASAVAATRSTDASVVAAAAAATDAIAASAATAAATDNIADLVRTKGEKLMFTLTKCQSRKPH